MEDRRGGGSGPAAWGSAGGAGHQWGSTVATSCDVEDWRLCGRPNALDESPLQYCRGTTLTDMWDRTHM
jgi:hypothetical protein